MLVLNNGIINYGFVQIITDKKSEFQSTKLQQMNNKTQEDDAESSMNSNNFRKYITFDVCYT